MKILQTDYSGSHLESIDKNFLFLIEVEAGSFVTRFLPDGRIQKTFSTDADKLLGDFQ